MVDLEIPLLEPEMVIHPGSKNAEVINDEGVLLRYDDPSSVKVSLTKNVRLISAGAFKKCKRIADIFIPDTVRKIESGAFANSPNIQIVSVDNSTEMENGYESVFRGCGYITLNVRFKDYTQAVLRRIY